MVLATGQRSVRVSARRGCPLPPGAGGRVAAVPSGDREGSYEQAVGLRRAHVSLLPASGAWREGDPVGHRQLLSLGDRAFALEGGGVLRDVTIAYETWGTLASDASNAVLVCHALTGDSHAAGPARPRATRPPAGGTASSARARASTPTGGSSCAPTCSAAARAPPARPARTPTTASRGAAASRWCRCATGCARRRRWPTTSASGAGTAWWAGRWAGCRCSSGR